MAHTTHELAAPAAENFNRTHAGVLPLAFLAAAVIGILGSLIGLIWSREQFAYSWLFAFSYFFTLCCGGLFWTIVHHATDAEWSVLVRRQLENLATLIPVFALLFLPLLIWCAPKLWVWWDMNPQDDPVLAAKQGFLNKPFFIIRYI